MDGSAERGEGTVIRTDNDRGERHDAQDPQRRQQPFPDAEAPQKSLLRHISEFSFA